MDDIVRKKKLRKGLFTIGVIAMVLGLVACAPQANNSSGGNDKDADTQITAESLEQDEFGVISAEQWKEAYPEVYASYEANNENAPGADKHDYLEYYPFLKTLYAGFGFAKGYDEAASHTYSLESVTSTPRVGDATLANCITCKSPQFTALVNSNGEAEYAKPFSETIAMITEPISCYNCHENDPTTLTVTSKFFATALGSDSKQVAEGAQACGQCHNEYYFDPDTKATTLPYTGLAAMNPDDILAYYDEMGFSDWKYPGTDTPMLKVQHPEFETVYGGNTMGNMASLGYSCSDCHMGTVEAEDGTEYTSHTWQSPLENQILIDNECKSCHADLKKQVTDWQTASEDRVFSIGAKIEQMVNTMVDQVASGQLTGDKLAQAQKLHRTSQFYWDFVMVENSEGAHNPELSDATLDKAEAAVDEAIALLAS